MTIHRLHKAQALKYPSMQNLSELLFYVVNNSKPNMKVNKFGQALLWKIYYLMELVDRITK